ncbi:putative Regulator protein [Streptomyces aurantiacus JA 4570]|uniref:Putative Regulator protein n=2 Tax=Streptomyces aurantiacus TaxID=47760 RepID=S3ZS03_9ACTN|nr:putative Regulator protein [Streptomyces aurantiacus JA 4570]
MITATLAAVGSGMANEAGKQLYLLVGGLFGGQARAPERSAELAALAPQLLEAARRDPVVAGRLAELQGLALRTFQQPMVLSVTPPPPAIRTFVDRQEPLRRLRREALRKHDGRPRRALLYGPEGIGTTGLAVQFGASAHDRYPDGRLYVDLAGGRAGTGLDAEAALRSALRGLGVPDGDIPPGPGDRAALFQRLVDGRRMLVILDHAHSAAQAGPLLAASADVFTVVVARRRLPGLDAAPIAVEPLSRRHSLHLLKEAAGSDVVGRLGPALPAALARCAGSPYALWATAAQWAAGLVPDAGTLVPDARTRVPDAGTLLPHAGPRTDDTTGGGSVSDGDAFLDDIYRALDPGLARLYRRAALWPWPAFTAGPVAAAAEVTEEAAGAGLDCLVELRLLERVGPGRHRYRPLVLGHAERMASRDDGVPGCSRAMERTLQWYLRFAVQADLDALPERWHLGAAYEGATPGTYPDRGRALAALLDELDNLVQAVLAAGEFGFGDTACSLMEALWAVQLKAGRHETLLPALRAAAQVADTVCPGTRMAGRMHIYLASALIETLGFDEAEREAEAALVAERRAGHLRGQATAVETLGRVKLARWAFREADDLFAESGRIADGIGPGDDGVDDLPRIRALLQRFRGRAQRGIALREGLPLDEAEGRLTDAIRFFDERGERYNGARARTDLAELYVLSGRRDAALPLIDWAVRALAEENAGYHVAYLRALRDGGAGGEGGEGGPNRGGAGSAGTTPT